MSGIYTARSIDSTHDHAKTVLAGMPMRGSIIRVDSPISPSRVSGEGQLPSLKASRSQGSAQHGAALTHAEDNTPRTPLGEVPSASVMNGASTTATLANGETRRLTMPPMTSILRKVSTERFESPTRSADSGIGGNENETPGWSSAVGHATTSGKSGRVIERLMAENDRLKRDLELQLLRSQELERNLQTMRPQLDALRAENSNLSHLKSVDGSLLSRRDRKIETLKEDLAAERSRREAYEALVKQITAERDNVAEEARRDIQQAHEEAKHSSVHASILEQSHKQLATDYRTRAERWRKDIDEIESDRRAESQKLARLEVVAEQMRSELERSKKAHHDFGQVFENYRDVTDRWRNELETLATRETARSKALSDDMQTVVDKMRWVMSNHALQTQEAASPLQEQRKQQAANKR